MSFLAGQRVTAEALNIAMEPGTIIGRGRRVTTGGSSAAGAEVGVLRIDDKPLRAGHGYKVCTSNLNLDTTVAGDEIHVRIRYTTDGSTPTTASTELPPPLRISADDATFTPILPLECYYFPAADETFSALLTIQRVNPGGAGSTVAMQADGTSTVTDLLLIALGEDPGDTGTDI